MFLRLCFTLLLLVFVVHADAQLVQQTTSIVYLKNGLEVCGTIISLIPDVSLTLELPDGEQILIAMQDISEIKRTGQYVPMPIYKRKSPAVAVSLSLFVPGLGQLYNGDYGLSGLCLGVNAVGWGLVIYGAWRNSNSTGYFNGYRHVRTQKGSVYLFPGLGITVGNYVLSMIQAYKSSISHNKELQNRFSINPTTDGIGGMVTVRF